MRPRAAAPTRGLAAPTPRPPSLLQARRWGLPTPRRRSTTAATATATADDGNDANTTAEPNNNDDDYDARRVAYNRMRHERDRANRRERVQRELSSLTEAELAERRERGRREAERRRAALAAAAQQGSNTLLTLAIDCSYAPDGVQQQPQQDGSVLTKAVRSLAKQLELSAALNKRSARPALLNATSFSEPLASFATQMGAQAWPLFTTHEESLLEVFPPLSVAANEGGDQPHDQRHRRRLVVLSPDAQEPLDLHSPLDRQSTVYVIGGIVDRSVKKGLTLSFAERHGLDARRLPVAELADRLGRLSEPGASKTPILNVSDVVACLLAYDASGDWLEALEKAMPARKLVAGVAGGGGRRSRRRARRRQQEQQQREDAEEDERRLVS